jgi:pyruvate,water dikinase
LSQQFLTKMDIVRIKKGKPHLFSDIAKWGGKGDNLLKLSEVFNVPSGFVISSDAYLDFIRENQIGAFLQKTLSQRDHEKAYQTIRTRFTSSDFSGDLVARLQKEFERLETPLAIRSSSIGEDGDKNSYAGQHETILGVTNFQEFMQAMKEVYASLFTARAIEYRQRGSLQDDSIALVVQTMIDPVASGVAYSPSPNNPGEILVESTWGLCTSVVDGRPCDIYRVLDTVTGNIVGDVSPKKIEQDVFSKTQKRVVTQEISGSKKSEASLTNEQVLEAAKTVKSIERAYGCPMDMEFAFDKSGNLYVLQARPITTMQNQIKNIVLPNIPVNRILARSKNLRNQGIFEGPAVVVRRVDHVNKSFDIDGDLEEMNRQFSEGYVLLTPEVPPQLEQYVTNARAMYATECGTTGHAAAVASERGIIYLGRGASSIPNLLQVVRSGTKIGLAANQTEGILYLA